MELCWRNKYNRSYTDGIDDVGLVNELELSRLLETITGPDHPSSWCREDIIVKREEGVVSV